MAVLTKKTVQRLAVLHALSRWRRGAYGPLRLHKTLFFADKENDPGWRVFAFKRYYLGQYSDEIADSLNELRGLNRIRSVYDGPSERLRAELPIAARTRIDLFFRRYFSDWYSSLGVAFDKWAYLNNDTILERAHDDSTYVSSQHGQLIFPSFDAANVEFSGLTDRMAERLSDFVDVRLHNGIERRLAVAGHRPARGENWRKIYFDES